MKIPILFFSIFLIVGCKKESEWLDVRTDKSIVIPSTLKDFKALLSNEEMLNTRDMMMNFIAGEPYYITDALWDATAAWQYRNMYSWSDDLNFYDGLVPSDWSSTYAQVYYCNTVLDGLKKIQPSPNEQVLFDEILGTALFFRSYAFFKLMNVFTLPYDASKAKELPGIPLPLIADVNQVVTRVNMADCYERILSDLENAKNLLPASMSYNTAPIKHAAMALLARIHLSMGDFDRAYLMVNQLLTERNGLIDFNSLTSTAAYPIPQANVENIFHTRLAAATISLAANVRTDSILFRSYDMNDMRRSIFFNIATGVPLFKGSYDGTQFFYGGLATNEMYLIRAECHARAGRIQEAMTDINTLLIKRWKAGTFVPFSASSASEALNIVLSERRKELVFRGLGWMDLRRLNKDPHTARILVRVIHNVRYELSPGDNRYAFLIPEIEVRMNGLIQNPR